MAASYKRQEPTACRHGHPYTEENTVWIKSSKTFDGRTRNCRECRKAKLKRRRAQPNWHERSAAKMRDWRTANPEREKTRWQQAATNRRQLLLEARIGGCVRCGEADPACLDFHHRDPTQKLGHIGEFRKFGMERLLTEIAKCDVLCANCHRKLHRDERANSTIGGA